MIGCRLGLGRIQLPLSGLRISCPHAHANQKRKSENVANTYTHNRLLVRSLSTDQSCLHGTGLHQRKCGRTFIRTSTAAMAAAGSQTTAAGQRVYKAPVTSAAAA